MSPLKNEIGPSKHPTHLLVAPNAEVIVEQTPAATLGSVRQERRCAGVTSLPGRLSCPGITSAEG